MKIVWMILLSAAMNGCSAPTKEDITKDLIREKLKSTLPDFSKYASLNFGTITTASLPYQETNEYITNTKELAACKDSIALLEKIIKENTSVITKATKDSLTQLLERATTKIERNKAAKQGYTPEKLYKLTHAYTVLDAEGHEKKNEAEFYIDNDLKKVVKVVKVY